MINLKTTSALLLAACAVPACSEAEPTQGGAPFALGVVPVEPQAPAGNQAAMCLVPVPITPTAMMGAPVAPGVPVNSVPVNSVPAAPAVQPTVVGAAMSAGMPSSTANPQTVPAQAASTAPVTQTTATAATPPAPEVPQDTVTIESIAGVENEHGFSLMNSFYMVNCISLDRFACNTTGGGCNANDQAFVETFKLGGDPEKTYSLTLQVNGVLEAKYYTGGTRRRGADFSDADDNAGTDTLYIGGEPIRSNYNIFKLSVFGADYDPNNNANPLQHYFLNSFPEASDYEAHRSFAISYELELENVAGGSVIEYLTQDDNCKSIRNCGPGLFNDTTCPAPRTLPNEPDLEIPESFGSKPVSERNLQGGATQPYQAQIVHITVTSVSESE